MLKILHIAPLNVAGVPYSYYAMHNQLGDESRLITLHKNDKKFPEDICLDFPLPSSDAAKKWRKKKVKDSEKQGIETAPVFHPKNLLEKIYFNWSDRQREDKVEQVIEKYDLNSFDIIHYDGGLDFYRYPKQAINWKKQGKKIVCCYYGSDLRIRGIIPELDEISDLNITSEFDHLKLKKDLEYLFYPYDPSELPETDNENDEVIKIVHSPTKRKYKGTELIIEVIEKVKKERKIEFILCENIERKELLKIKSQCHISIDQVGGTMGGTGYGKAGIETLAMGIPTITNMTKDYEDWLPENPFILANNEVELYSSLISLIDDRELRKDSGEKGKQWVEKYHSYKSINQSLNELYKKYKITS